LARRPRRRRGDVRRSDVDGDSDVDGTATSTETATSTKAAAETTREEQNGSANLPLYGTAAGIGSAALAALVWYRKRA